MIRNDRNYNMFIYNRVFDNGLCSFSKINTIRNSGREGIRNTIREVYRPRRAM